MGRDIPLNLRHLEARLRQSGHLASDALPLDEVGLRKLLTEAIATLDVAQARTDVERFLLNPTGITVWSKEFFEDMAGRIRIEA